MPTALRRQYARLERQRAALLDRLGPFTDAQRAFQPDPESWSLAGVVQHLVLVEEAMVRNGRRQAATRSAGVTLRSRILARMLFAALGRDIRVRAPVVAVVPRSHLPLAELVPRWAAARADLMDYVEGLPGPLWWRTAFFHPGTGWITAMGGLRLFEVHCAHHLRQIERIAGDARFPVPDPPPLW